MRHDNTRSSRDEYLRTSDEGLEGLNRSKYTTRINVTGPPNLNQDTAVPREYRRTTSGRLLRWVLPNGTPTRREPCWRTCRCAKPKIEDFTTKSYCLIKYWCSPYPDKLQLSMGLGNSPQLNYVDRVQTKHTRRRREGTRKQVQGIRAEGARASTTRSRRHSVSAFTSRLVSTQTKARYAQAGAEYA